MAHRFSNRKEVREAILQLAAEPTDRQEIEQMNTSEFQNPYDNSYDDSYDDSYDETEECEECGHAVSLHMDRYGCQYERGDIVVNECNVAGGPCGCDVHHAKFKLLEAIKAENAEIRATLANLDFLKQKLSAAYSTLLVSTRTNVR
jgi:hypothetical protein